MVNKFNLLYENNDLKDYLLMVERGHNDLDILKEMNDKGNEDFILEGIFAEFGTKNNNNRVYDEKDYLPHLTYLQEKIDKRSLMGELDHPSGFSTSLTNVSHIVEKLEYDQSSRTVRGRIRILDTPSGRIAKDLIRDGVPLSISSRAAGIADPRNGNVTLKKIVTYDLVADPGFENASLSRVNENYMQLLNESANIIDTKLELLNESFGLSNDDNLHIYKILEASNEDLKNDLLTVEDENTDETKNKDSEMEDNKNMVTEAQLEKYSAMVKKVWEGLEAKLENAEKEIEDLKETISALKEADEAKEKEAAEEEGKELPSDELSEGFNYLNNLLTKHIEYVNNELVESINKIGTATDANAKVLNEQIDFVTNDLFEAVNEHTKLFESFKNDNEEIVSKINENAKLFESFKNYTNEEIVSKMNENTKIFESFKDYTNEEIVSKVNEGFDEQTLLLENLKLKLDNKLFEDVNPDGSDPSGDEEKLKIAEEEEKESADEIIEKIKEEVEEVEKEKALEESLNQYPFHSVMNEKTTEIFAKLDESKKETVREKFMAKPLLNESYITRLVESVNVEGDKGNETPKWIEQAPIAYKKIYEGLDFNTKERLHTRAKAFNLDTPYQINNFWTTSGLEKLDENYQEQSDFIQLNEEKDLKVPGTLGYSPKVVEKIKSGLKRFNS